MSILGPTTDVDRAVWQRRAVKVLHEILDAGFRRGLPVLSWRLGCTGVLIGTCVDTDQQARRAAFIAWADLLGIDDWRAWDGDGVTYLSGVAGAAFHGPAVPRCKVMISAAVDSPAVQAGV